MRALVATDSSVLAGTAPTGGTGTGVGGGDVPGSTFVFVDNEPVYVVLDAVQVLPVVTGVFIDGESILVGSEPLEVS